MKPTAAQKRFVNAALDEQVRLAMPLARQIVRMGFDDVSRYEASEEDLVSRALGLVGDDEMPDFEDAVQGEKIEAYAAASYALGIAVGLLVRPEVFAKDGVR